VKHNTFRNSGVFRSLIEILRQVEWNTTDTQASIDDAAPYLQWRVIKKHMVILDAVFYFDG
jgi:hypothetical protein